MFSTKRRPAPRRLRLRPPRCLPAWSHVQHQPSARSATSSSSATTLLASVEPCSKPAVGPARDVFVFGHHAARQRGAMFKASRLPATRPLRPPRCLPAWSHVQNQPPACHALSSATTLLASVEPCSKPAVGLPRALFGHHAACQRGAMFKASRRPATRPLRPPRCLPAWSHVQSQPPACHAPSSATTLLASVEPCSKPAACLPRALFGHHAACQRGAMFKTSRRPSPSRRPATASSVLNTAPRWRAAWWRRQPIYSQTFLVLNTAPRWRAAWWRRQPTYSQTFLVLNTAPRWRAAWWRSSRFRRDIWS